MHRDRDSHFNQLTLAIRYQQCYLAGRANSYEPGVVFLARRIYIKLHLQHIRPTEVHLFDLFIPASIASIDATTVASNHVVRSLSCQSLYHPG